MVEMVTEVPCTGKEEDCGKVCGGMWGRGGAETGTDEEKAVGFAPVPGWVGREGGMLGTGTGTGTGGIGGRMVGADDGKPGSAPGGGGA